jgi:hypothetical protein
MGRRKRKSAIKGPLCIICQASYSPSSSIIPRSSSCNSLPQHAICDSCLHKHIFTVISKDITNQIICPAQGCNTELPRITIQTALSAFGYQNLWEEYVFKSNWRGTSNQWIKRFTVKCPGCRVPIEKNGGCDHMVCRQCHLHFNWNQAKNFNMYRFRIWWRTYVPRIAKIFFICLTIVLMFFFIKFLIYHKKTMMVMVDNLLIIAKFFSNMYRVVLFK